MVDVVEGTPYEAGDKSETEQRAPDWVVGDVAWLVVVVDEHGVPASAIE